MKLQSNHVFDFEIGDLVSSPCRTCERNGELPACAQNCPVLEKIRAVLSATVSSRHICSQTDGYSVSQKILKNPYGNMPM